MTEQEKEQAAEDFTFEYAVELPADVAAALQRRFDGTQKTAPTNGDTVQTWFDKTQKGGRQ